MFDDDFFGGGAEQDAEAAKEVKRHAAARGGMLSLFEDDPFFSGGGGLRWRDGWYDAAYGRYDERHAARRKYDGRRWKQWDFLFLLHCYVNVPRS